MPTTKTRRPHRKSRNGCAECKHRHIRCDERQPSCANCELAERVCSFLTTQAGKQKQKQKSGQRHRTKQQQQPEATAVTSPGVEASSNSNATTIANGDEERAEIPSTIDQLPHDRLDINQAAEQLSHRSMLTHDSLSSTTRLDVNPHQIPSPASPMQLSQVHTPPADCCPGLSTVPDTVSKAIFTSQHMVLMHHVRTVPNLNSPGRSLLDVAIRHAIDSPYLLDEVLAFTAFYLAGRYPGSAVYLRGLSAELQNRALTCFTEVTKRVRNDDKATAVPRFLFSAILGRHALADTLTHCRSNFHLFIDRFVECINLNRGIRVVTPPAWDYLYNTEIRPFISIVREAQEKIVSPGHECDPLSRVMDDSDLNETSVEACRKAVEVLQWSFDLCQNLEVEDYPQSVSAFSVRVGGGFIDVLRKHRPEALLVLAYYGVLLYRCRNFWAFGDAGASMIRAVAERVGSYWQDALAWPLHVLETERSPEPVSQAPDA